MASIYKTAEVASIIGVHPNTVRLYEKLNLIPKAKRLDNGYRVFNEFHIEQFKLARTAFKVEILQNGLRKKIINIIKTSARGDFQKAIEYCEDYINQLNREEKIENQISFTRKQAADYLDVTIDTLRNWEMNGLLSIKRKENGYRIYTEEDIKILKIIRSLRCANYSIASILRMINEVSKNSNIDIREVIDTPNKDEDIVTACDKLLTSLNKAEENAKFMMKQLVSMKGKFNNFTL
ncbi:MAG: MerR family transcriptional regulator [Clostridium sp.]|uniref:MerR family transcriptional regulator n=1 Tax=Clostridium sp. TaxID=1506 RepID=UPI002A917CEB|nr:MerR family transcriptional regulator [Clostridium sp.]MDY6228533.1 MerR family transcriptional regulator [Clostridium sp.]